MRRLLQPSEVWRGMHRGHNRDNRTGEIVFKIPHPSFRVALLRCVTLKLKKPYQAWRYPYACRWTDDYGVGDVGPVHWHIGRVSVKPQFLPEKKE